MDVDQAPESFIRVQEELFVTLLWNMVVVVKFPKFFLFIALIGVLLLVLVPGRRPLEHGPENQLLRAFPIGVV